MLRLPRFGINNARFLVLVLPGAILCELRQLSCFLGRALDINADASAPCHVSHRMQLRGIVCTHAVTCKHTPCHFTYLLTCGPHAAFAHFSVTSFFGGQGLRPAACLTVHVQQSPLAVSTTSFSDCLHIPVRYQNSKSAHRTIHELNI